jgi:hypothetical protein
MSEQPGDPLQGAGQGGGTGGVTGSETDPDPADNAPQHDDDVDQSARPADEQLYPERDETGDRGFAGEDVGRTEDGPGTP